MNELCSKILSLFPEVKDSVFEGDEELTYVMMQYVADWVRKTYNEKNEGNLEHRSIVKRIRELRDWCLDRNGDLDTYTVYIVSLYEPICEDKSTHSLIPLITEKEDFIASWAYLTTWIGTENYETILRNWKKRV